MADQASEGLLSPFLQRRRISAVLPFLQGRVLDVGCGAGALANFVEPRLYLGVERDDQSLRKAQQNFPQHTFQSHMPDQANKFDTVVALAVIEHVANPAAFLTDLATHLAAQDKARVICTTPHPSLDWIHDAGAAIGLFSKHASDEHEDLLDVSDLVAAGLIAKLKLVTYKRFLAGANQLALFKPSRDI